MRLHSKWLMLGPAIVLAGCAVAYPGAPVSEGSFERTIEISGPVRVEVATGSGQIDVRSAETETVKIKARVVVRDALFDSRRSADILKEIVENPRIEHDGELVRIGPIADWRTRDRTSISYDIIVPSRARLLASTGSGDQSVEGVLGSIEATTGSGNIEIRGARSDVRAKTGSGSVRLLDALGGSFELATGSGDIDVERVKGKLEARTGSGGIEIEGEPVEGWFLKTGSGSVTAEVPASVGLDVAARTGSGDISVEPPFTESEVRRRGSVRGRIGAGGTTLEVTTGSGDIRIEQRDAPVRVSLR